MQVKTLNIFPQHNKKSHWCLISFYNLNFKNRSDI
nr:MAG TPA: hypothetical protein [Bacteriophage sp.]